jgi:biotin synthase
MISTGSRLWLPFTQMRDFDALRRNPRPGTPFGDRSVVEPIEAPRFVAMARLALPTALIRFAGGREITLQGLQDLGMRSGASGLVLGNYLTTRGRGDQDDFAMLNRLGFEALA